MLPPTSSNEFEFGADGSDANTTVDNNGFSKLWRLRFDDITNPNSGGTITMVLDGTDAGQMYDNMTISDDGKVILQEDPGNQVHLAKVWEYDLASGQLRMILEHNKLFFTDTNLTVNGIQPARDLDPTIPGKQGTTDEESSGVIDLSSILGPGHYALNVQAHYGLADPLVEAGQILIMNTATKAQVFQGELSVQGTAADDIITVARKGKVFTVTVNNVKSTFDANLVTHLRVDGLGGNDKITVSGGTRVGSIITGGTGNDYIREQNGPSIIVGGMGTDTIFSGGKNDLIISGSTTLENNEEALRQLYRHWATIPDYATAVAVARETLSGEVTDDGVKDLIKGGGGNDAFWIGIMDDPDDKSFEYVTL